MSLVIAIKLENDDVLFVSDRRVTTNGPSESYVAHADDQSTKAFPMLGGVMGFAGRQDVALYLLRGLQASAIIARPPNLEFEYEIKRRLEDLYLGYVPSAVQEQDNWFIPQASKDYVEFIFAVRSKQGCRITTFSLDRLFTPHVCYDSIVQFADPKQIYGAVHLVTMAGAEHHARMLLHWFNKKSYTLEEAKRLAILMIAITNDTNPSLVNKNINGLLLTIDDNQITIGFEDTLKWVEGFMTTTKDSLYRV